MKIIEPPHYKDQLELLNLPQINCTSFVIYIVADETQRRELTQEITTHAELRSMPLESISIVRDDIDGKVVIRNEAGYHDLPTWWHDAPFFLLVTDLACIANEADYYPKVSRLIGMTPDPTYPNYGGRLPLPDKSQIRAIITVNELEKVTGMLECLSGHAKETIHRMKVEVGPEGFWKKVQEFSKPDNLSYQDKLKTHLSAYKHKHLGGLTPGNYKQKQYDHILPDPDNDWELNLLAGFRNQIISYLSSNPQIKRHQYFHHLNSSQAFALNLFVPFFEGGTDASKSLLTALGQQSELVRWEPEKIPNAEEETNIDVFWETTDGVQTFCEVKLSENDFGKATNDKRHQDKLNKIYLPRLAQYLSPELQAEEGFFNSYQILRNIWHMAVEPKGRLVFLIPRENSKLWPTLDATLSGVSPSVRARITVVAIEDVLDNLVTNQATPPHLRTYAQKLAEKYVPK